MIELIDYVSWLIIELIELCFGYLYLTFSLCPCVMLSYRELLSSGTLESFIVSYYIAITSIILIYQYTNKLISTFTTTTT